MGAKGSALVRDTSAGPLGVYSPYHAKVRAEGASIAISRDMGPLRAWEPPQFQAKRSRSEKAELSESSGVFLERLSEF